MNARSSLGLLVAVTVSVFACGGDSEDVPVADGGPSGTQDGGGVSPGPDGAVPTGDGAAPVENGNGLLPANAGWKASSEWYRSIATAPVAEHSDAMIAGIRQWGQTGVFQINYSFVVLDGAGATKVGFPPSDETDAVPVPVPERGYIEGGYAYPDCPNSDEDCHLIVVDRPGRQLFEVFGARKNGSTWEGSVAWWQFDKTYPRTARGQGCTSADAAGLAITPGLIGYKETKAGSIDHALRLVLRNDYIRGAMSRDFPMVAYPATHGSTATSSATSVPYGARLRLKASVRDDDPRFTSPGAKAVLKALHTYGMIVADGGNIPLMAESDKLYAEANPAEGWAGLLEPRDLGELKPSDFEVIGIPKDIPTGAPGWYSTKAEYEAQLKKPFGCTGIVQP